MHTTQSAIRARAGKKGPRHKGIHIYRERRRKALEERKKKILEQRKKAREEREEQLRKRDSIAKAKKEEGEDN